MEYRSLNITVIAAEGIKNVKLFSKMNVYAVVELQGYPLSKKKTFVDKDCGTHPKWNHRMEFVIDEPYVTIPALSLVFTLMAETSIGCDKVIGSVIVPVHDLYNNNPDNSAPGEEKNVEYQICTPKNRARGTLKLLYHFGEKFTQQLMDNKNQVNQTAPPFQFTAGTVYTPSASPPPPPPHDPGTAYPQLSPPPVHAPYPPPGGYGYSPPPGYLQSTLPGYSPAMSSGYSQPTPPGHGQAPPPGYGYQAPPLGYGYQAPPAGYGYQAPPPQGYGYQAPPQGYGYQASPQAYAASSSLSSTSKKSKKNKRKGEEK